MQQIPDTNPAMTDSEMYCTIFPALRKYSRSSQPPAKKAMVGTAAKASSDSGTMPRETMAAPKVIAKGRGFMALRIREIASKARVPVLERKPLARALYASTEVGTEIPRELFKAVAEVLSYVCRLKNPYGYRQAAR